MVFEFFSGHSVFLSVEAESTKSVFESFINIRLNILCYKILKINCQDRDSYKS